MISRVDDYLEQIRQAAHDAISFVEGFSREDFFADKRTQQAVAMSIVIIGEAATKLMDLDPAVINSIPGVPWRNIRGMRSRIAHGYFAVDLGIVWDTVQTSLPALLEALPTNGNDGGGDGAGGGAAGGPPRKP
jgi:uncharacterized protein with HEPN domain